MSRINPIKPKNPWEKVKIFYEKINFYQEIKIFSHQDFLYLFYSFNFCFLLSISGQFSTDMSRHISKWSVSGCRPAVNLSEMTSYQPSQQQFFIERPQNLTVIEGESVTLRWAICYLPVLSSDLWVIFLGVRSATWRGRSSGRLTALPWATIWPPSGATAPSVRPGGTLLMVGGLCGETDITLCHPATTIWFNINFTL